MPSLLFLTRCKHLGGPNTNESVSSAFNTMLPHLLNGKITLGLNSLISLFHDLDFFFKYTSSRVFFVNRHFPDNCYSNRFTTRVHSVFLIVYNVH